MKAVNLLPQERRGSQRGAAFAPLLREPLLAVAIAGLVVVVAALALTAHSASTTLSARHATIRQLDAQLAKIKPVTTTGAGGTASRLTAVTSIASQRPTWDGFFNSLSRVMPEDVWLLNLSVQASAAATTPATPSTSSPAGTSVPSAFTVTGYTYSQPSVARTMRRLELVPWLRDVSLVTSTKSAIDNHTVYQFTVGANFVSLPEVGT
jgi:Tfp pilus assembly protein PilN